jgi:short-subunit dehydrogenase
MQNNRPLAVITGASSGIGFELAKLAATEGYDLVVAADEPEIHEAAQLLTTNGAAVEAVEADLATLEGVDRLFEVIKNSGAPVEILIANAGRGLGHGFLDQDFTKAKRVVDTNVTGTIYLVHKVGNAMRDANRGKILLTGSIAGFMPGTFQAVYNGTKSFINSFAFALRNELKETDVTVTCLMPGATETRFFERAEMLDTKVGQQEKDDAADVAKTGWAAMMRGDGDIVSGIKNKIQSAIANVTPAAVLAEQHRSTAEPGSGKK